MFKVAGSDKQHMIIGRDASPGREGKVVHTVKFPTVVYLLRPAWNT